MKQVNQITPGSNSFSKIFEISKQDLEKNLNELRFGMTQTIRQELC